MKLLIQDNFTAVYEDEPEAGQEDIEANMVFMQHVNQVMNKFSVHGSMQREGSNSVITIPQQKVTLDELDMNELFHEVLYLIDYKLEYAGLGGAGCDFSMTITKPLERI